MQLLGTGKGLSVVGGQRRAVRCRLAVYEPDLIQLPSQR